MSSVSNLIWQRGSGREIMREAQERFRISSKEDLPGAYVARASVHHSLTGRYLNWLQRPLAVWHMWRAAWNVKCALSIVGGAASTFNADQIEVISAILAKAPWWLEGDRNWASSLLLYRMAQRPDTIKPHTKALMCITLGEIYWLDKDIDLAKKYYHQAWSLIIENAREVTDDELRQWVRVESAVGFFFFSHGDKAERDKSHQLIYTAYGYACRLSKDQEMKIRAEAKRHGYRLS